MTFIAKTIVLPFDRYDFAATSEELKIVHDDFGGDFTIPPNFQQTAAPHSSAQDTPRRQAAAPPELHVNPQTTLLCEMLGITDPTSVFLGKKADLGIDMSDIKEQNPDEIDVGSSDSDDVTDEVMDSTMEESPAVLEMRKKKLSPENGASPLCAKAPGEFPLSGDNADDQKVHKFSLGEDMESSSPGAGLKLPAPRFSSVLNLPDPTNTKVDKRSATTEHDDKPSGCGEQGKRKSGSSDADEEPGSASSEVKEETPGVKKFKRRNQSFYESADN